MSTKANEELKVALKLPATLLGEGSEEFMNTIKRKFDLTDVVSIKVVDTAFEGKDTLLYINFVKNVPIQSPELQEANGVVVELGGTLTLRFDERGELDSYVLDYQEKAGVEEAKTGLVGLMKTGNIYFARPGEKVDISGLIRQRVKFYIQEDDQGRKRLHRVFFA